MKLIVNKQYTPVLKAIYAPKSVSEVNVPVILKNIDIFNDHSTVFRLLTFLGAFALRKVTVSLVMPFCPSSRTEQPCPHWTDFHEILYFSFFRKSVEKILVSLKSDKNTGYFTL